MKLRFQWLIVNLVIARSINQECPSSKFPVHVPDMCTPESCNGECYTPFTCCVDLCFPLNMTQTLMDSCNMDEYVDTKTCSRHTAEMTCIANITSSSTTVCHEQVKWMTNEGLASFAPLIMNDCPCEEGYRRVESVCRFVQCKNPSDCINMTDPFYDLDICCCADYLVPKDDICDEGQEVIGTVLSQNVSDCHELCEFKESTCKSSTTTFSACCDQILESPSAAEEKELIEGADGVIVVLVFAFSMIAVGGILLIGVYCIRRKSIQKHNAENTKGLGLGLHNIEAESAEGQWTHIAVDLNVADIEESINDEYITDANTNLEVKAIVNTECTHYRKEKCPTADNNLATADETIYNPAHSDTNSIGEHIAIPSTFQVDDHDTNESIDDATDTSDETYSYSNSAVEFKSDDATQATQLDRKSAELEMHDSDASGDFDSSLDIETALYFKTRSALDLGFGQSLRPTTPRTTSLADSMFSDDVGMADII